ncbi:B-cell receptor CD22-like [Tachysurus fulvidraco]|uniref:B-cell receptor CD22-like n=1 Tax=Tachysurus fulvidraco TaxID=1234273 RepID=UPI001FED6FAC|nr:B-cell receptor CD22-like [Tachysurus fulvidraco]
MSSELVLQPMSFSSSILFSSSRLQLQLALGVCELIAALCESFVHCVTLSLQVLSSLLQHALTQHTQRRTCLLLTLSLSHVTVIRGDGERDLGGAQRFLQPPLQRHEPLGVRQQTRDVTLQLRPQEVDVLQALAQTLSRASVPIRKRRQVQTRILSNRDTITRDTSQTLGRDSEIFNNDYYVTFSPYSAEAGNAGLRVPEELGMKSVTVLTAEIEETSLMMRVMVSLQFILLASLLFLVAMTVVESQQTANLWYKRSSICALKGSTVTMGFTYVFNLDNEPQRVYWGKDDVTGYKLPDLALEPQYSDRVQYVREGTQDWTLSLSNVMGEDQGTYHAVVVTMSGRFPGSGGVILTVSDLWVERIRGRLVEGDEVTLTCKTSCNLTETPLFIWNKDGSFFSSSNPLHLLSVSWQDAGSYSCSVRGKSYLSSAVNLNVQYPPKRVSVSISPSGDIVEDSSVTLTCSSDANPPVQSYTWYKGTSSISTGNTFTMSRIRSEDSGDYKCKGVNRYGEQYSDVVTLNVLYPPKRVSVSISPSGEIVEDSSVTLTCSSDANPPVHRYTWFKGTSSISRGNTFTMSRIRSEDSGEYKCKSSNPYGDKYSNGVTLNVLKLARNVSVSISPSGEIVEGSSVTLTCSSKAKPPVEYAWLKKTSTMGTSKTYTFTKIRSEDSGKYTCKSKNLYGEELSEELTVNVLYPPKSASVSVNPTGGIMEGSSVTLTCSSDANPPVQSYTWYKGEVPLITEKTYAIRSTSSEDSGEYKCKSSNQYGEKFSKVTLNVLYPPKNVSVSISEIVEGSLVTLTCSSDANPPVHRYTWYKVNKSSPVGSGQSYSFTLTSSSSGQFYCVAQNIYGGQRAPVVGLTLNASLSSGQKFSFKVLYIAVCVGVGVGVGVGAVIARFFCMRRKRQKRNAVNEDVPRADDNTYVSLDPVTRSSNDVYSTISELRPGRPDDTYVALDPHSVSDDYSTLTVLHF